MAIYIALLRGINVGGKNVIKMAELKRVLGETGLLQVQTYIQSGNVLFRSDEGEEELREKIEHSMEAAFGFPVPVVLRKAAEIERMIADCPFSEDEIASAESSTDAECLYVSLLIDAPLPEKVELLDAYRSADDDYRIIGREVYLLFHHSIRDSKLANNLHRLDVPQTVRNWKTINKLMALAAAMES